MLAIFKREFRSYFKTVYGYLFLAIFLFTAGLCVALTNFTGGYGNFEYAMLNLPIAYILVLPVLTMRTLAEERRNHTDQLLYSLPISSLSVIAGKYLALLAVLGIGTGVLALYPLILSFYGTVPMIAAYTSLLQVFLMGAALAAMCMFLSSLTKSPVVSVLVSIGVTALLYLLNIVAVILPTSPLSSFIGFLVLALFIATLVWFLTKNLTVTAVALAVCILPLCIVYVVNQTFFTGLFPMVLARLALFSGIESFNYGIFDAQAAIYEITFAAFFLFLTVQAMEKRRWC